MNTVYQTALRDNPLFEPQTEKYAFRIKSFDSDVEKTFIVKDTSPSPMSFQMFHFNSCIRQDVESLANGEVYLTHGSWNFKLFALSGSTLADIMLNTELSRGIFFQNI